MRLLPFLAAAALAAAVPLTAAACQQLPAPAIAWAAEQGTVPFELYRGTRVYSTATINGHSTPVLLDSGASITTLDRAFARSIGIKPGTKVDGRGAGGVVEAELIADVTLAFGGMTFEKMTVAVMDFSDVAKAIGRPIPLVLGSELFNAAAIGIDWDRKQLTLTPTARFTPPADARLVPLKARESFHFVEVAVAGLPPIEALFDLGNGSAINLPSDYWSKQPLLANLPYAESQIGGVGGLHPSRAVTLPSVTFAGQTFRQVPAGLGPDSQGNDPAHGSNVGIGLLKQFRVTLDLGNSRMFLAPLASPPPFVRDRAGVRTTLDGDALKVAFASPQGPGHAAGIRAGDRIVAIDGRRIDPATDAGAQAVWGRAPAGTKVALALADGRAINVTLADFY